MLSEAAEYTHIPSDGDQTEADILKACKCWRKRRAYAEKMGASVCFTDYTGPGNGENTVYSCHSESYDVRPFDASDRSTHFNHSFASSVAI
ncbi:MAG: hypothetical protein K0R57_2268 [Paenibacillaceae bacterium]|jgi:hypothetical protein|nr:hypothetical protein [Paenibacillaceae bacterium]